MNTFSKSAGLIPIDCVNITLRQISFQYTILDVLVVIRVLIIGTKYFYDYYKFSTDITII